MKRSWEFCLFITLCILSGNGYGRLSAVDSPSHYKLPTNGNYTWRSRQEYYYSKLEEKMSVILHSNCLQTYTILPDHSVHAIPNNKTAIYVVPSPPTIELQQWWKNIAPPKQMRVDPYLCEVIYTKFKPILANPGCQLPHYMTYSAPRCQTR